MTEIKRIGRTGYIEVWHCHQPEVYRVTHQEWNDDYAERHIYEVDEVTGEVAADAGKAVRVDAPPRPKYLVGGDCE